MEGVSNRNKTTNQKAKVMVKEDIWLYFEFSIAKKIALYFEFSKEKWTKFLVLC